MGNTCLFLPWNSPCSIVAISASHLYHPMSLPKQERKTGIVKMPNGFCGAGSIGYGVKAGMDIVVTLSTEDNLATKSVIECINNYVSIDDPFADVQVVRSGETSIAGQLDDVFTGTEYQRVLLLWPYQDVKIDKLNFNTDSNIKFFYSHKNGTPRAGKVVTEVVGISAKIEEEDSILCKSAMSVGTIDEIVKGSFTRLVSSAYINREQWTAFQDSDADDRSVGAFLSESLKGETGALADPNVFGWII